MDGIRLTPEQLDTAQYVQAHTIAQNDVTWTELVPLGSADYGSPVGLRFPWDGGVEVFIISRDGKVLEQRNTAHGRRRKALQAGS